MRLLGAGLWGRLLLDRGEDFLSILSCTNGAMKGARVGPMDQGTQASLLGHGPALGAGQGQKTPQWDETLGLKYQWGNQGQGPEARGFRRIYSW